MSSPTPGVAFLLAQVGAAAAERFATALEPLGLTPAQAGLMRLVAAAPGTSQQELAARIGVAASRVVGYLDDLERRDLVVRRPGSDRRVNEVSLTKSGRDLLARLATVARKHDAAMTAPLQTDDRDRLHAALGTIAEHLGLRAGIHPGYRTTRQPSARDTSR